MDFKNISIEKELTIVYMGTPIFSAFVLDGILKKYKIRAVVTQPDRLIGKDKKVIYSKVKSLAIDKAILVLQPEKVKENYEEILALEPDLIITCAYGQIIPKKIINYPKYGCINVHASLLPELRGGAPIQRAIMNGNTKTGITIMYMNEGMDTGDIISQKEIEITPTDTGSSLHDKLAVLGRDLLLETLPSILNKKAPRIPQKREEGSYGFIIKREDERIRFSKTKKQICDLVRALNSYPGAYCLCEGKILKVWKCYATDNMFSECFEGQITAIYNDGFGVKASNGEIVFTEVQMEGKNKMSAIDFVNGIKNRTNVIGKILD